MESSESRFGWAADDPRWGDAQGGGNGRLEAAPAPAFGGPTAPEEPLPWPGDGHRSPPPDADPYGLMPPPLAITGGATVRDAAAGPDRPAPDLPGPSTAESWSDPALWSGPQPWSDAPSWVDTEHATSPVPTPLVPAPATATSAGYGLLVAGQRHGYADEFATRGGGFGPPGGTEPALPRGTRLDRQVRLRRRRGSDDEFYQATRAELLSDDARYKVLFALTGAWYVPIAAIYLAWTLVADGTTLLVGLGWLVVGAVLSVAIAGLLRWAQVSWRAVTLSLAAAIVGGAVATLAHSLSS